METKLIFHLQGGSGLNHYQTNQNIQTHQLLTTGLGSDNPEEYAKDSA